jgi:hypothetical protein
MVFILIHRQAQGFGEIDSIVEYGSRAEGGGFVPYAVGHCAGARMHLPVG